MTKKRKNSVVKEISPLKPEIFKSILVSDTAFKTGRIEAGRQRTAIFKCVFCMETYENIVVKEKHKKAGYCNACFQLTKPKSKQTLFKEKVKRIKSEPVADVKLHKTNTSGFRNVTWSKRYSKWQVQIQDHYQRKTLGYFDDKVEAALIHDMYIDENNLPNKKNFNV